MMEAHRFVNNTVPGLQNSIQNLLTNCEHLPIVTLEQSLEKISDHIPDVLEYASTAKKECRRDLNFLTWDESAAIYLYTMPKPFFSILNTALRTPDRQFQQPWLPFLKLLMTALEKLPSIKATIWRGVKYDATSDFVHDSIYTWWSVTSCSQNISRVEAYLGESGTLFAIETVHGKDISMLSAVPEEGEVILMPGTQVRAKHQSLNIMNRYFIIQLEAVHTLNESNHIFEQIKQEYRTNSRIELFMNPAISFPFEQCYINLSLVENKEQREKETLLHQAQHTTSVIGAYEDIYAVKTPIDAKDIFNTCKTQEKQVLVFGRAGIGKSTFCRYIAYQWAMGSYWSHYQLLALIPLRQLTADRYPPGKNYSLIDVVKTELFPLDLTANEEEQLIKHFDAKKTLWILDGHDEIVQNTPPHLQTLLAKLRKTPHHIITSRPYLNTLSYRVQMEIIGFTDENIQKYVHNFFHQMQDEINDASVKNEKLLQFLKSNASIWGVAHIPVNLELICSLWTDEEWSKTKQLTMTKLYTMMTEWLCRRYLTARGIAIQQIPKDEMYECCKEELTFTETLAFHTMKSNTILLRPILLKTAMDAAKISLKTFSRTLNMGILKSVSKQGISTQIETDKDHYFLHLSFQEYFAARYLSNALNTSQTKEAIDFIRQHKYNQRYTLLFSFTAGLLSENGVRCSFDLFWNTVLGPTVDLVGIRHMQLVIACMEEVDNISMFSRRSALLEWIIKCLQCSLGMDDCTIHKHILESLQRAQSIVCDQILTNFLVDSLSDDDISRKTKVFALISQLNMNHSSNTLVDLMILKLDDGNIQVRKNACNVLSQMGENAATKEVISKLTITLEDQDEEVKEHAYFALGTMGEKAVTNDVLNKLGSALEDHCESIREKACDTLGRMGEKAATNDVLNKLGSALKDPCESIREKACDALGRMGEKAATNDVLNKLESALEDHCESIREKACDALGRMGEKAATNTIISKLFNALDDKSSSVRSSACHTLGNIGERATTDELINKLISMLNDQKFSIRDTVSSVLATIGKKAATTVVIDKLLSALEDCDENVRATACHILAYIGEKAATKEVTSKLLNVMEDQNDWVRQCACSALGKIYEETMINDVISKLMSALDDLCYGVRSSACASLGVIGQKRVTNDMIHKIVGALEDDRSWVRMYACIALENIGEQAATDEVISKLLNSLEDDEFDVIWYASIALGSMGKRAATNEVMSKILSLIDSDKMQVNECLSIFEEILRSPQVMKQFNPIIFKNILQKFSISTHFQGISEKDFINIFCETRNSDWLPVVMEVILGLGSAIVAADHKLIVYSKIEPYEILIERDDLYGQLIAAFSNESKRFHLCLPS